jgi:1-deoxy-D-xylulose-5-phosphate synthase
VGREGLATFSGAFPAGGDPRGRAGTAPSTKSAAASPGGGSAPLPASVGIVAIGNLVAAAEDLETSGIDVTLWDARCCAPLDTGMVVDTEMVVDPAAHAAVVTLEDRMREGGIGMTIADRVRANDPEIAVYVLGLATRFIPDAATPDEIVSSLGLDHVRVAKAVKERGGAFLD